MKKLNFLGILMLLSIFSFSARAEINYDLASHPGGELVMGYDAVSAERNKAQAERWITVVNFANSGTAGACGVSKTFDIKSGRTIDFFLAQCDQFIITANVATGRGLVVTINDGPAINLAGTGTCNNFVIDVNSEVPVKIRVNGKDSNSSWTSLFKFTYEAKTPKIEGFKVNGISAAIDQDAKTITLELPFGNDISAVTPEVTIGGTAVSYSPEGAQNFTAGPVVFTVTDGTESVQYTANITVKATPDTEKAITALTINGRAAVINEETGTISCVFPAYVGTLGNWPVIFELNSITATSNFVSGGSFDFSATPSLVIIVTAQDNSTKVYTVTPTISTKKDVAILAVNGKAESYDNLLLSAFENYTVEFLAAPNTAPADIQAYYANYDLIVLHANVSGTNGTAIATKALVGVKPILNLKAFFYNSGRWSWSSAAPQNAPAGTASVTVETHLQGHPVFQNVTFNGNTLQYYDNLPVTNTNAVQYASDLNTLAVEMTSHTIATFNQTGIQMHEIQDNVAAKFFMVGLSMENNNYTYFNTNTINILKNAADYLLNSTVAYNYTSTQLENLRAEKSIFYSNGTLHNPAQSMVYVYTLSGQRLIQSALSTIDVQSLPQGAYIVQSDSMQTFKFIK